MVALDPDIVERFTGQRMVTSVEAAANQLHTAQMAYARAGASARRIHRRLYAARCRRSWCRARHRIAALPSSLHVEGWALVLTAACLIGLGLAAALLFCTSLPLISLLCAAILPFSTLVLTRLLFPTDVEPLKSLVDELERAVGVFDRDRRVTEAMFDGCGARLGAAKALYHGLIQAQQFPLNRLLNADFGRMSGPEFENFLAEIFRLLGYAVTQTGRSGDQGVDLVVRRDSRSIAIQAKCYADSVGNGAVQQVYAGMIFYRCDRCAVITSSAFTRGAFELARSVNCQLVGGRDIPRLIRGRLQGF